MRRIVIVDAPSVLGLKPPALGALPGARKLPRALKKAGLAERLRAEDGGEVAPLPYTPDRDEALGVRNPHAIREYSLRLADRVGSVIQKDGFALVLGGDCSILIGALLALRRIGRYGLFFVDGHTDFHLPETSRTGGVAGMDLAIVTGRGPDLLTDFEGLKPLVSEKDVVLFGYRDVEADSARGPQSVRETQMLLYDLDEVEKVGIQRAASDAISRLAEGDLAGCWIHLDADVLDDEVMPAVDSRQPRGMSFAELSDLLRILLSSGLAVGMDVTIFDPELDGDGCLAKAFTDALVAGFAHVA